MQNNHKRNARWPQNGYKETQHNYKQMQNKDKEVQNKQAQNDQ